MRLAPRTGILLFVVRTLLNYFNTLVLLGDLLDFSIHVDIPSIRTAACKVTNSFSGIEVLFSVIGGFPFAFPDSWTGFLHSYEPQSHKYLSTYDSLQSK
jgi:hypothetical protein